MKRFRVGLHKDIAVVQELEGLHLFWVRRRVAWKGVLRDSQK
jgi:hypothetical protein